MSALYDPEMDEAIDDAHAWLLYTAEGGRDELTLHCGVDFERIERNTLLVVRKYAFCDPSVAISLDHPSARVWVVRATIRHGIGERAAAYVRREAWFRYKVESDRRLETQRAAEKARQVAREKAQRRILDLVASDGAGEATCDGLITAPKGVARSQRKAERYAAVLRMRECGLTYKAIGTRLGVSGGRAQQIHQGAIILARQSGRVIMPLEVFMSERCIMPNYKAESEIEFLSSISPGYTFSDFNQRLPTRLRDY